MNDLFYIIDSVPIRLGLQIIWFLMALIVAQMVWREYRRSGGLFLKYIAIAFGLLLLQAASKLGFFTYGMIRGAEVNEAIMPMVDHLLKVASFLFLTYSFSFASNASKYATPVFQVNVALLVATSPFIWYQWLQYIVVAPLKNLKFSFFWADRVYETWILLTLCWGVSRVFSADVRMRRSFILSFGILILMVSLHLLNILTTHNTYAPVVVLERLLMIPYFYVIIMAIHAEIINDINTVQQEKEELNEQLYRNTIQALVGALEVKDLYTQGHARRVMEYSTAVGERLGLTRQDMKSLYLAAILHDIGKIGTHEDILNKPSALLPEEAAQVRQHPLDGAFILEGIEMLRPIVPIVMGHHERWDGCGYPERLRGDEIPLASRIISVADAFDAMTSDRAYRKAMPLDKVFTEIRNERGKQFDPVVADVFLEVALEKEWWRADGTVHCREGRFAPALQAS